MKLILASQSPRRVELLQLLGLPFQIIPSEIDENIFEDCPKKRVEKLAFEKNKKVGVSLEKQGQFCVISADTVVYLNGQILEKPIDLADAKKMLLSLGGKTHQVYTGVTIATYGTTNNQKFSWVEETLVTFAPMIEELLIKYLQTGDSLDKSGGYGIQSMSKAFISSIEGCPNSVMGLPLQKVHANLKNLFYNSNLYELFN